MTINDNIFFLCTINDSLHCTDFYQDITFETIVFQANCGMEVIKIQKNITIQPNLLEISFFLNKINFSNTEKYKNTTIQLFTINNNQKKSIFHGKIIEITSNNQQIFFKAYSNVLHSFQIITQKFSSSCRANFGDHKCKFNLETVKLSDQIVENIDNQQLVINFTCQKENGYFNYGYLIFKKYPLQKIFIKKYFQGGKIILLHKASFSINKNDKFDIYPGCDKSIQSCQKFQNIINFQGENYLNTI